jgi:CRP/FNR family nitrogen fixation transcriptional regulator
MEEAMQTVLQTRSALQETKPDCVTPDTLDLLEQFGTTVAFQRAHEIFAQGEPTEFCWRIVSGCVRTVKSMVDGSRQIGEFLWPGDLFGMDDLGTHELGAEAVTDVTLRRYPRRMVEALAKSHIALALWLRSVAVANLRRAYQQMIMLGRRTAMEKIATFVLEMECRSTAAGHRLVDVPMSRSDIADHLCLTIETVSRVLTRLHSAGIVVVERCGLELRDRVTLIGLAYETRH